MKEDEYVKEALEIREQLDTRKMGEWTGDELARVAMKLSILLTNIGQMTAEAARDMSQARVFYKLESAREFRKAREMGETVRDAEARALEATQGGRKAEIDAKYQSDALKAVYSDLSRLVMVIQSRLKSLNNELRQASLQT